MSSRHRPRVTIALPGEETGRRSFLKKGIVGAVLLTVGGGVWLGTRRTRPVAPPGGLRVFSAEEGAVLLAVANRFVPERPRFPRPAELRIVERIDAIAAMSDPATQDDLRRLVRLFESGLAGLLLDAQPRLFTESSPAAQDRRLRSWAHSRIDLRRTGYRALKRLVYAGYYAAPETWPAIGYPGPPIRVPATAPVPSAAPSRHGD